MKKLLTLVTAVSCIALNSGAPAFASQSEPTPSQQADNQTLSAEQMQADILQLAADLKAHHPRPFRIISPQEFDALVKAKAASFDAASTRTDLIWAMSEILASIGCGHTRMSLFNQENALIEAEQRFPADIRLHDGRLFVMDPLVNGDRLSKGQEIVAINGVPVPALKQEIYAHITSDTDTPNVKPHQFNIYATAYLTYALGFPQSYSVRLRSQTTDIALAPLSDFTFKPIISPLAPCQDQLCYSVDEKRNIGIMKIRSFDYYGARGQIFADFTSSAFKDLEDSNRSGLIIDTRGVRGGSGLVGSYILRHLADKPFAYMDAELSDPRGSESLFDMQNPIETGFDGPTFILMDGLTVSSVSHFFALAQENGFATLIGQPSGGGKSTNDGKVLLKSGNSGIEYNVARMRFDVTAPSLSVDEAVRPDIWLTYSREDVLDRTDSMMPIALDLLAARTLTE